MQHKHMKKLELKKKDAIVTFRKLVKIHNPYI